MAKQVFSKEDIIKVRAILEDLPSDRPRLDRPPPFLRIAALDIPVIDLREEPEPEFPSMVVRARDHTKDNAAFIGEELGFDAAEEGFLRFCLQLEEGKDPSQLERKVHAIFIVEDEKLEPRERAKLENDHKVIIDLLGSYYPSMPKDAISRLASNAKDVPPELTEESTDKPCILLHAGKQAEVADKLELPLDFVARAVFLHELGHHCFSGQIAGVPTTPHDATEAYANWFAHQALGPSDRELFNRLVEHIKGDPGDLFSRMI